MYWLPNSISSYDPGIVAEGSQVDQFNYVFVDMDLKEGKYKNKQEFIDMVLEFGMEPTHIVDSGNGVHVYWQLSDLDAMSYLRLQRRLIRCFHTDEAVCKLFQLMRAPDTMNTKEKSNFKTCTILSQTDSTWTCEQLDKLLPPITQADEEYCQRHYDSTYKLNSSEVRIDEEVPRKFMMLLRNSKEVRHLYEGNVNDRSKADFKLAHILFADGFTREEAMSVLVNCKKALERSPTHRFNYAHNIVDKLWAYEEAENKAEVPLSNSVKDILRKGTAIQGIKFPCWNVFDGTQDGFRLTQVLGLIGGAGSGKTTLALNYFYHFTRLNSEYIHLFVSLEQPEEEIARRWDRVTRGNINLHDKVHVLSNYNADGTYRNLSLSDIEDYVIKLQDKLKTKVGCVVIDHIGVLKKVSRDGENQGLIDICHGMKAFAKRTNTFLVMQSQTSREKSGIGDLELDKDAAYGTSMFEWYCDYVVTTWQPIKRVYFKAPDMTCSAFKYCKIRHKNVLLDNTKEDTVHVLMYDPGTELLREMNQEDEERFSALNLQATTLRNKDRKREPTRVTKIDWTDNGKANSNQRQ